MKEIPPQGLWICFHCGAHRGYMETDMENGKAYQLKPGVLVQAIFIFCNDNPECIQAAQEHKRDDVLKDMQ